MLRVEHIANLRPCVHVEAEESCAWALVRVGGMPGTTYAPTGEPIDFNFQACEACAMAALLSLYRLNDSSESQPCMLCGDPSGVPRLEPRTLPLGTKAGLVAICVPCAAKNTRSLWHEWLTTKPELEPGPVLEDPKK